MLYLYEARNANAHPQLVRTHSHISYTGVELAQFTCSEKVSRRIHTPMARTVKMLNTVTAKENLNTMITILKNIVTLRKSRKG
jgi:hypothetical protein